MVQVPVLVSIVTVALVTPPTVVRVPSEQTPLLPASTDNPTFSPEVESAATGKVLWSVAVVGAGVVNEIVWPPLVAVVVWLWVALR